MAREKFQTRDLYIDNLKPPVTCQLAGLAGPSVSVEQDRASVRYLGETHSRDQIAKAHTNILEQAMIADQKKLRVLIVENEFLLQLAAEDLLQQLGHEAIGWATRASSAIAETERKRPDCVLMDIELDGARDGIDAARHIKERFGVRSLFMTGSSSEEIARRARNAKPLGYLQKPLSLSDLESALAPLAGGGDVEFSGESRKSESR
jgi:CheY-like chemotaxis protein